MPSIAYGVTPPGPDPALSPPIYTGDLQGQIADLQRRVAELERKLEAISMAVGALL